MCYIKVSLTFYNICDVWCMQSVSDAHHSLCVQSMCTTLYTGGVQYEHTVIGMKQNVLQQLRSHSLRLITSTGYQTNNSWDRLSVFNLIRQGCLLSNGQLNQIETASLKMCLRSISKGHVFFLVALLVLESAWYMFQINLCAEVATEQRPQPNKTCLFSFTMTAVCNNDHLLPFTVMSSHTGVHS